MNNSHAQKLLLLIFYRDFTLKDYRGLLSKDDYHLIERALDCLWGSSCLIPYPDYLKMSKLCLGQVSELGQRLDKLEELKILEVFDSEGDGGDVVIREEDRS